MIHEHHIDIPTRPASVSTRDLDAFISTIRRAREDLNVYRDASRWDVPWTEQGTPWHYDDRTRVYFTRYLED